MKTRIISGIVMIAIVAAVIAAGLLWNPIIVTIALALLAALGVYEMLRNVLGVKEISCILVTSVMAGAMTVAVSYWLSGLYSLSAGADEVYYNLIYIAPVAFLILAFTHILACALLIFVNHKDLNLAQILGMCASPLLLAVGFAFLNSIIVDANGIYYLLLLLNFSCICDTGAYFTGVTIGKHKLCPEISPKKTVEGAVGGIVSSIICTLIITLCFGADGILAALVCTIPLCIIGMMGDLFASSIKRAAGVKDYGNLIPGHGGVLDRVDSILFIAPALYIFILLGVF